MPYKNRKKLPEDIKNNLPKEAQDIWKEAFNSAWDQYDDPEDRDDNESRETVAAKVAWSAVKKEYKKENGEWVKEKD